MPRAKRSARIKKRGGSAEEVAGIMEEMRKVGDEIAAFDADIAELEAAMDAFLMTLPNFPHESVPAGQGRSRQRRKAPLGHAA